MKRFLLFSSFFTLLFISSLASTSSRGVFLTPDHINLMIVGDTVRIKTEPQNKNINYVKCEVQGEALSLVNKSDNSGSGYVFTFKAVKAGNAVLLEKTSKFGKKKENLEIKKFRVRVIAIDEIPRVSLQSIAKNPKKYAGAFVLIQGTSRSWGSPVKAKKIWGTMVTRSDWVIEDTSGAAYISGIPKVEKGKSVKLICRVVVKSNGAWALFGHRLIVTGNSQTKNLKTLTRDNNHFALGLYKNLSKQEGNLFFSPFSISDALAMTYVGARGETEKQMAKVLHFTLPQKDLHPAFSKLIGQMITEAKKKPYTLHLANALWEQKGYPFLPNFTNLIDRYYEGGFFSVDFVEHTEEARNHINNWVEKQTNGKIKDLIAKGDINYLTRLILTNAIYFKGKWASQFKEENTRALPFYLSDKKSIQIPMMYQEENFPYYESRNLKLLELPYAGDTLSMIIFLPKNREGLAELERNLTPKKLSQFLGSLKKRKVRVYLPRFKLKTKYYLKKVLSEMGMPEAFSRRADFSGMDSTKRLKISKVIHQAYVNVNEEGTEAAAATAVVMQLKAMSRTPEFRADHPFLFVIVNRKLKSILFMGRVINPNQQ